MSLSARRAWIEIAAAKTAQSAAETVALRKESVDRNRVKHVDGVISYRSLSARRAWIEIKTGSSVP